MAASTVPLAGLLQHAPASRAALAKSETAALRVRSSAWRAAQATAALVAGLRSASSAALDLRRALADADRDRLPEPRGKSDVAENVDALSILSASDDDADADAQDEDRPSTLASAPKSTADSGASPSLPAARATALNALEDVAQELEVVAAGVEAAVGGSLDGAQRRVAGGVLLRRDAVTKRERELCEALQHYGKMTPRRDAEKQRFEASMRVYNARKSWHHALLEYAVGLNTLAVERGALLDEPLLLAVRLFQQNGLGNSDTTPSNAQEHSVVAAAASASATNTATTPEPFHGSHASRTQIAAALERLDEAITQQHDAAAQQQEQSRRYADNIKATTEAAYHLDLDPDDPFVNAEPQVVDPRLESWRGYVLQRVTKRGVGSARWRLAFLEVAQGVLAITPDLELEPCQRVALQGCQASTELSDDRRYLLKLRLHNAKKPLVFQAPNDYERQQWVVVFHNAREKGSDHVQSVRFRPARSSTSVEPGDAESESEDDEETDVNWETSEVGEVRLKIEQNRPPVASDAARSPVRPPPPRPPPVTRRSNPFT